MTSVAALVGRARAVVFDKDGTLTDLDARWLPFFESFIDAVTQRVDERTLAGSLRSILGVTAEGLVPELPAAVETGPHIRRLVTDELVDRGVSATDADAIVTAAESSARPGALTPLGGVAATIGRLAADGRLIGIATSDGRTNTVVELGTLGVLDLVDALRCGDDEGPVKPDPAVLLGLAEAWGLTPADLLYVGDSHHDLQTARAAGVPFIAVGRPDRPAWSPDAGDARVTTIDELVATPR
ncbi:MAG: HAD family hydrolase [Ilumatobacteraceae bacterium]